MAGPRIRRSLWRNPPPGGEDELVRSPPGAPTKGSNTPTPSPPVSWAQTPADAPAPTPAPPRGTYTDADLQKVTKLALDSFIQGQAHAQGSASATRDIALDGSLKARKPDLYYGCSHMECYHFCRQCEDYFETAGTKGYKRVPFAASFLRERINFCWQQHKTWTERDRANPLTWDKFKAFLRKSLGESTAFVNSIWSKIKRDSQYQQEEVQDWTSHLEHLQSILLEFDTRCTPTEDVLCRHFYEGLRPSIWLWIDEEGWELDG